jgi:acyl-[acyl-carrier-protein]-phospholipid O-acyltransferase/long-chain-fatty-acid--[acyl-carrier-protein] ligase
MFLAGGALVGAFAIATLVVTAEYFVRLVLLAVTNTVYRVDCRGAQHLPDHGGALLVCNHVSFIDAVLIASVSARPVRFLMYRDLFELPLIGWFARRMGAIPISSRDGSEARDAALQAAADAAAGGELVCIFAEGAITRTGSLLGFASGLEQIAARSGVPIVPVALDRLWGSIFSFHRGGRFFWKRPLRLPYPVDVSVGAPLPSSTVAAEVRARIQELIADLRRERRGRRGSLAWRFLHSARRHGRRTAIVDGTGMRLSYRDLLLRALALRAVLERRLSGDGRVAVLLPPGAGGALANVTLALCGKTSVNLNYTLSNAALQACLERAGVRHVVTSERFLRALGREAPLPREGTLFLEDLGREVTRGDKLAAFLLALLPGAWLAHLVTPQRHAQEVATVIFSSGSTGAPKGVQLTHGNVLSNVQSVLQVLAFGPGDALLGVLPFFHSFGYTVTLWAGLLSGAKAVFHANPLEAQTVGELCEREHVTVLVATPTLYQAYLRRCPARQFRHVRLAISGAQKLPARLADEWRAALGSTLMEGYGATELSPVISCNLPDPEGVSPRHAAHRPGTVGRPLPGVVVRAVGLADGAPLAPGEEGLLEVKGPNVMLGYLGEPEETARVLRDGWYSTGDIGRVEPDGFVVLTDRLSRFSKIGGEMVPHGLVEEELNAVLARLAPGDEGELAVTAVADERRGEELVVLHAQLGLDPAALAAGLAASQLPALFRPRPTHYLAVDELPKLGTGKLDLQALARLAAERLGAARAC